MRALNSVIPRACVQAWGKRAPWRYPGRVERDLIISRAVCELFNAPVLRDRIVLIGGTAIYKLLYAQPIRFSRDIDLVHIGQEPVSATIAVLREVLPWMSGLALRPGVEFNGRRRESLLGVSHYPFAVENDWYQGKAEVASFVAEELFSLKLLALLVRHLTTDLFDLHHGLEHLALRPDKIVDCFHHHLAGDGRRITRALAERHMLEKLTLGIAEDIDPFLPAGVSFGQAQALRAFERIWTELIPGLHGEGWRRTDEVVASLRQKQYPGLLMTREPQRPGRDHDVSGPPTRIVDLRR